MVPKRCYNDQVSIFPDSGLISIDWFNYWCAVDWWFDNGQTAKGPTVDVRPAKEGFVENLFGDVNPLIGSVVTNFHINNRHRLDLG